MTKKYEIVLKYIKDLSVEIPDAETFIFSRENITKYSLGINITSNQIKDETLEIITKINYKDKQENKKKSYFEISYWFSTQNEKKKNLTFGHKRSHDSLTDSAIFCKLRNDNTSEVLCQNIVYNPS